MRRSRPAALTSSSDIASCAITSSRCNRRPDAIVCTAAGGQPGLKRRPAQTKRRQDTGNQRRDHGQCEGKAEHAGIRDAPRSVRCS